MVYIIGGETHVQSAMTTTRQYSWSQALISLDGLQEVVDTTTNTNYGF